MKKILVFILVLSVSLVFLASCGSSAQRQQSQSGLPDILWNAYRNVPEGVLVGVGEASLASQSQSRLFAENRARAAIARAMNSMVQEMIRDYQASSEVDPGSALAFQENMNVTLTNARLQGAVIVDQAYIDGVYYIVMHMSADNVAMEINQAQAAARLAVPAMASFDAQARMYDAFDRASQESWIVAE